MAGSSPPTVTWRKSAAHTSCALVAWECLGLRLLGHCLGGDGRRLEDLGVNKQLDGVGHKPAAGLQRDIPVQPEVLAVDAAGNREAGPALPLHVAVLALQRYIQRHLACHIADR